MCCTCFNACNARVARARSRSLLVTAQRALRPLSFLTACRVVPLSATHANTPTHPHTHLSRSSSMSRRCCFSTSPTSPSTCIRQHTSACVCIRQHTSACCLSTSPTSPSTCIRSIRQHTSAYVSIHLHTPAYVSMLSLNVAYVSLNLQRCIVVNLLVK
jgi:hypothetical protein